MQDITKKSRSGSSSVLGTRSRRELNKISERKRKKKSLLGGTVDSVVEVLNGKKEPPAGRLEVDVE